MVACNSHQTTPRSRARDQLSQYFIGLCLKFEILSREPPWELSALHRRCAHQVDGIILGMTLLFR